MLRAHLSQTVKSNPAGIFVIGLFVPDNANLSQAIPAVCTYASQSFVRTLNLCFATCGSSQKLEVHRPGGRVDVCFSAVVHVSTKMVSPGNSTVVNKGEGKLKKKKNLWLYHDLKSQAWLFEVNHDIAKS